MRGEVRPVKLRFFDPKTTKKFTDLCTSVGISTTVERDDSAEAVTTQALTSTERRALISKWADISMERIT